VLVLSGLYTLRLLAGSAATGSHISPWLAGFSVLLLFSLAIVKRFADVILETARWANTHQAQSAKILEKYTQLAIGPTTTRVRYAETFNPSDVQPVIDVSAKYGLIKKSFPAADFYAK